ncbi:MAG: thermonuclease family protein [Actinomycetota bacterium]|nr:thermonuclease family protein [Actinomycetota bacterium]
MIRRTLVILFFLTLPVLAGCGGETVPEAERDAEREVTVTRVIDGDTIEVRPTVNETEDVRLIGVDAPETAGSPRGAQPYGERASRFARQRLEGRRVTLRFDVEKEDDYGRVLAYVYLPDGSMFNEMLLEEGYAQLATFPPNVRHLGRFRAAQRMARKAGRGIWGLSESQRCRLTDRGNGIGGGC